MATGTTTTIRVPTSVHELIRSIAEAEERTIGAVVQRAVRAYLQDVAPDAQEAGT